MGYNKNDKVGWNWGSGEASGKIKEVFERDVERTIKGSKIKRKGSKENPAYLIEQEDGSEVLKSHSELKKNS